VLVAESDDSLALGVLLISLCSLTAYRQGSAQGPDFQKNLRKNPKFSLSFS